MSQIQVLGRNGLIDGWRGLSVLLVIAGHLVAYRLSLPIQRPLHELGFSFDLAYGLAIRVISPLGDVGVQFFFMISGYLITTLLTTEEQASNEISIRAFYLRRVFRILPAFIILLLTVFALRARDLVLLENQAFWRSAAFLCNVSQFKCSWWLAHTWSLSVEEQFYLAWPLLFVVLRPVRVQALQIILFFLVLGSLYYSELTSFVNIAVGALVAASSRIHDTFDKFSTAWPVTIALSLILLMPLFPASLTIPSKLIHAASPFLTAIAFFGSIARVGPLVPLLQNSLMQKIGLASYSIYLWQQLGTAPKIWNGTITGADVLYTHYAFMASFFVLLSIASYLLVERPFIRLGKILSQQMIAKRGGARSLTRGLSLPLSSEIRSRSVRQ
jgi:peptidoglycan/LPS O-acetylase OafA/YrhL